MCPSITEFRSRIRRLLENEVAATSRKPRDVVIFAIDGIPYEIAVHNWRHAETVRLRAVFPTTSSTCWLSSLTGLTVPRHGIPGVVFRVADGSLINVFEYNSNLDVPANGNIFSDAARLGYEPCSIMGDFEPYDCSWRTELLRDSRIIRGYRFYTTGSSCPPAAICDAVRRALKACTEQQNQGRTRLIWCFIDADQHIHRKGYDDELSDFLGNIEKLALELAAGGMLPLAHSDHGLVRTAHNAALEQLIHGILRQYACSMGGAGRTRWIYAKPEVEEHLAFELRRQLKGQIRVCEADIFFEQNSIARTRVGEVLLVADGEEFMTFSDHRFDHGSLTDTELFVPLSSWHK
jgi:hypothetical protein